MPERPLAAIVAYADFLRFGALPRAGGTQDQPAGLMRELRIVHSAYTRALPGPRDDSSGRARPRRRRRAGG